MLATAEITTAVLGVHLWAGGSLPSPIWLAMITATVLGATLLVLPGRVRLRVAVPSLAAVQLLLHWWLVVLEPVAAGHHQHASGSGLDPRMLLAHCAGAVVTALVWRARRRAVELLLHWSAAPALAASTLRRARVHAGAQVHIRTVLARLPLLRGPPQAASYA